MFDRNCTAWSLHATRLTPTEPARPGRKATAPAPARLSTEGLERLEDRRLCSASAAWGTSYMAQPAATDHAATVVALHHVRKAIPATRAAAGVHRAASTAGEHIARPAVSSVAVNTYFIDRTGTWTGTGGSAYNMFTLSRRTTFVLRYASDYTSDGVVLRASQLSNFTAGRAYSYVAGFTGQFGTKTITLDPGSYAVAARNRVNGTNNFRYELDYDIGAAYPSLTFRGNALNGSLNVAPNGGKGYNVFTIQRGFRYFLDGTNSGVETYVIPASEFGNFKGNRTFRYYTAYSGTTADQPGLVEVTLPPGQYYLVFRNRTSVNHAVTYTMQAFS